MNFSYFGKLSSRADFVRYNASGGVIRAMDAWIQEGLRFAEGNRISDFETAYDASGPSCFVLHALNGSGPVAGVIRPSRDASGRKYPFFIATEPGPALSGDVPVSLFAFSYANLFRHLSTLVDEAVDGQRGTERLDVAMESGPDELRAVDVESAQFSVLLDNISFSDFCRRLWGAFPDSRKYIVFKNLLDVLLPLRNAGPPRLGYGLQLPLIRGDLLPVSVYFWLEVCMRLVGDVRITPELIWNMREGFEGRPPSLYVNFSALPASGLLHIFQVPLDLENLFPVESAGSRRASDIALSIPSHYGRLIETESISLLRFLRALN